MEIAIIVRKNQFANNSLSNKKQPEDKYLSRENVKIIQKIGTS